MRSDTSPSGDRKFDYFAYNINQMKGKLLISDTSLSGDRKIESCFEWKSSAMSLFELFHSSSIMKTQLAYHLVQMQEGCKWRLCKSTDATNRLAAYKAAEISRQPSPAYLPVTSNRARLASPCVCSFHVRPSTAECQATSPSFRPSGPLCPALTRETERRVKRDAQGINVKDNQCGNRLMTSECWISTFV